jgi:hypothetical protein
MYRNMAKSYNRAEAGGRSHVIDFPDGRSFGEPQARLKALWSRRLAYQMPILPEYEEVFRAIRRTLRHANLP